ncbi:MAG TPA: isoprenylcysteine carboxylmethyltransferase family protein [Acidisarcina sp.]|nr:isoprenylcysteine carboxylmethyltransferase family protein [Acidisarcina sp.]
MQSTESRRESLLRWGISAAFVLFGGPGIVGFYFPFTITRWHGATQSLWLRSAAIALICLGLLPLLESVIRFVRVGRGTLVPAMPTKVLVVSGFYRYVRNPMYVGMLTLISGQAILFRSRSLVQYLVVVALLFHLFVIGYEEPKLRRTYGESYEEFCRHVPRWIPRRTPWG